MNNELWVAIYGLYLLLADDDAKESAFQDYFEKNPVVFKVLGFPVFASFEKSSGNKLPYDSENNTQREPDFICANPTTQVVTVFELKTPVDAAALTGRKDGQRTKFKAVIEGYFSQVAEYIHFIGSNLEARLKVSETLGLENVKVVNGVLVYGLTDVQEAPIIAKLANNRNPQIKVLHFDQVFLKLLDAYSRGRPDILFPDHLGKTKHLAGLTFVQHAVIPEQQIGEKAYIFDLGDRTTNRVSAYIENGQGAIRLVDGKGRSHYFDWEINFNTPTFIKLELSDDSNNSFVSVSIDNQEVALLTRAMDINVAPNFGSLVLGADFHGERCGRFKMLENYFVDRTMTFEERIKSYKYFVEKVATQTGCMEFDGTKFMHRNKDGNMVQEKDDRKPIYSKEIYFPEIE